MNVFFRLIVTTKSNFGFLCGVASIQESIDGKTLSSHCADLTNGPAERDVTAFDLERKLKYKMTKTKSKIIRKLKLVSLHKYGIEQMATFKTKFIWF